MNDDSTRVDLGEDLLEKTAIISIPKTPPPAKEESPTQQLESAKILEGEGFVQDAKKILRHLIIQDPQQFDAKKNLESIIIEEERKVFQEERNNPYIEKAPVQTRYDLEEIADLVKSLDRDLGLHVEGGGAHSAEASAHLSVTEERLEAVFFDASLRDRMDLAIAFIEMGVPFAAERQLRIALQLTSTLKEQLGVVQLLGESLLLCSRATEIPRWVDPFLADSDLASEDRIHLLYLRARASQLVGRLGEASRLFQDILEMDPLYRDTKERLEHLTRKS